MFRLIAEIFGGGRDVVEAKVSDPRRQAIWNAMVESFALHLRVLWDFFWPTANQVKRRDKGESNDVFAIDFFSSPQEWNLKRPDTLDQGLRDRINWLVAHLTEGRLCLRHYLLRILLCKYRMKAEA